MQNQIKKLLLSPWKRPNNWLHSFKPGNKEHKLSSSQKFIPIVLKSDKFKSNIELKCNKQELPTPVFKSSMKDAFVSRHEFSDFKRLIFPLFIDLDMIIN